MKRKRIAGALAHFWGSLAITLLFISQRSPWLRREEGAEQGRAGSGEGESPRGGWRTGAKEERRSRQRELRARQRERRAAPGASGEAGIRGGGAALPVAVQVVPRRLGLPRASQPPQGAQDAPQLGLEAVHHRVAPRHGPEESGVRGLRAGRPGGGRGSGRGRGPGGLRHARPGPGADASLSLGNGGGRAALDRAGGTSRYLFTACFTRDGTGHWLIVPLCLLHGSRKRRKRAYPPNCCILSIKKSKQGGKLGRYQPVFMLQEVPIATDVFWSSLQTLW